MKMARLISMLAFVATLSMIAYSCTKDGSAGPAGATGATGPVGPAGADGSQIYSGSGAPAATIGATGDYYLDVSTGNLYGPKTATGWGTPLDLKGAAGANGATGATGATGAKGATGANGSNGTNGTNGSQIYSGTTAPASTLGVTGDYYLDKATFMLYGPKTASGWGTPVLLQGPQGPMGNANVLEKTISVTNAQWLWNSQYVFQTSTTSYTEYFTRYVDCAFTALTTGILDSGMVLVYFTPNTSNNTNQWVPLPYQFTDGSDNFNYEISYETNVGTIRLHYFFVQTNPSATIPVLSSYAIATYQFKFVAVSGNVTTAMKKRGINFGDYGAVSGFIGQQ